MVSLVLESAARQHGVVSRAQLVAMGVSQHVVDYRLRAGFLTRIHRGVYRVGPVASPRMREMAAVLACGADAVLSHRSAAALWEVGPSLPPEEPVHVSVPRQVRSRADVRPHLAVLEPDEQTHLDGIPVTTVARTLLDLAAERPALEVEAALALAEARGLADLSEMEEVLARHAGRSGIQALRAALVRIDGPTLTRSEAERRLLRLLRKAEVARPRVNTLVCGLEVDFAWPDQRVAVEIDGFEWHGARRAFERDRERDAVLTTAGWRVMRVTWRQLVRTPEAVLARLVALLAAGL